MCINTNEVIDNKCGRLQELILIFGIPMGTRKNVFVINRQFGHAPSKKVRQLWILIGESAMGFRYLTGKSYTDCSLSKDSKFS
jgi:hypothetical protein